MKNSKKAAPYLILAGMVIFFVSCFVLRQGVFGSKIDWLNQHSVIPDYFRQQFYDTGKLFPEFAANIGGGQNIYNFSYYGLYSPVILFSYLLPWVKMSDYIMAASVLSLAASVMLFYKWLLERKFSTRISFFVSVYFMLAAPMLFHSYGHIMFVNYMPFLCLAFIGVDRYLAENKIGMYTLGVFLMIMTSFYFSIGGMLALLVYGVYRYFQINEAGKIKVTVKMFLTDGIHFLSPMLTAVFMSGILLLPTAMALTGKRSTEIIADSGRLFIPNVSLMRFIYQPYGIGLTTFIITVLITGLTYRKWSERFLNWSCVILLTVPLFTYLLNGRLYIRDKVWLPFLPLLCYLTAVYLEKQKKRKISFTVSICSYLLTIVFVYLGRGQLENGKWWKLMLADGIVMMFVFVISYRKRYLYLLIIIPIIFLTAYQSVLHTKADRVVERSFYEKVTDRKQGDAVKEILEEDGFYRTEQAGTDAENSANINRIWDMGQYSSSVYSSSYNAEYQNFRENIFMTELPFRNSIMLGASKNPLFRELMGVKYLISEENVPGYELYKTRGKLKIFKNNDVLPIIYATDKVISEEDYLKLDFPYNQTAFNDYAVVQKGNSDTKWQTQLKNTAKKIDFKIPEKSEQNIKIKQMDTGYQIHAKKKENVKITIPENGQNMLFLSFEIEKAPEKYDISIWLNDVKNKLSSREHIYYNENTRFAYAVPLENAAEAMMTFGKGDYAIKNVEAYLGNSKQDKRKLCQAEFIEDKSKTKGSKIAGQVKTDKDGYLITSIPYDSAFEIKIDGRPAECEKVNTAFLGTKIKKGNHKIEITYHAPGIKFGKMFSLAGVLMFVLQLKKKQLVVRGGR